MGVLRVYLALCVVAAHGGQFLPWALHDGRQAVQIFYMISGFYMSLILTSGKYSRVKSFYKSRAVRILIPYWAALLACLIVCVATGLFLGNWLTLSNWVQPSANGTAGTVFTGITNLTLFGQDWVMFLEHDRGHQLALTTNFAESSAPLYRLLVIPQCWTLGVELTFYLLVPFIHRLRSHWLVLLVICSLSARLYTYRVLGLANDPWDYRFFPFEIALFVTGMLAQRLSGTQRCKSMLSKCKLPEGRVLYFVFCLVGVAAWLVIAGLSRNLAGRLGGTYASLAFYPIWALAIMVLFQVTRSHKFDRAVGELSYPIYILHYSLIGLVATLTWKWESMHAYVPLLSAIVTIILSIAFYRLLIAPLDSWRSSLFVTKPDLRDVQSHAPNTKSTSSP